MHFVLKGSRKLVGALLAVMCAGAVNAQTLRDEGQRLLDEQRERERAEMLKRPAPGIANKPAVDAISNIDPAKLVEIEPAFLVTAIALKGDTLLSVSAREDIIAPFLGLKLGPHRLDLLLRRINAAYLDSGYITTRAYLGEQNLAEGKLDVTVIVGKVEQVTLNGEAFSLPARSALSVAKDKPLHLPDIEQSVDQINRLRSQRAQAQVQPGQSDGSSVVALETHPEKPWRASIGWDNYGQAATGEHRKRAGIEYDNLFGLWDAWAISAVRTESSRSEMLASSVPFGYGTASYAYAHSVSNTSLVDDIEIRSVSSSHTAAWNQVLARGQNYRQALDLSMTLRDSKRRIDDFELMPQQQGSYRISTSTLFRTERGAINVDLGYSHGIEKFGADGDVQGLPESSPHNLFEKWDANASLAWTLSPQLAWRTTLSGQYSRMGLPGQEQIYLGGAGSIRGFKEGVFSGDRGAQTRNELQWVNALGKWGNEHGARVDPFAFFDAGYARQWVDPHNKRISAAGLGVRSDWKGLSSELVWARPLAIPSRSSLRYEDRIHFTLAYQY